MDSEVKLMDPGNQGKKGSADEVARRRQLLAEGKKLILEAKQAWHALDQAWAARKEAIARSKPSGLPPLLPAPGQTAESDVPIQTSQQTGAESFLLIVEDDSDDYELLQMAIKHVGIRATQSWAQTGAEALKKLSALSGRACQICLIIDLGLPDISGIELLKAVRQSRGGTAIKVILLTGSLDPSLALSAQDHGADAFFLKTCRYEDLRVVARAAERMLHAACAGAAAA